MNAEGIAEVPCSRAQRGKVAQLPRMTERPSEKQGMAVTHAVARQRKLRERELVSSGPGQAFESPPNPWHVRGTPDVSLFEGPHVDRVAVANQLEQAWLAELDG